MKTPRLYLAGPGVFRTALSARDARTYAVHLKLMCAKAGCEGLHPLDNEISGATPRAIAQAIYTANVDLIDSCDAVVADISPFRGPNMDPGTAWEIGYAIAKRLPVFLYTSDARTLLERTRRSHRLTPHDDGFVDESGMSVEDFGLVENLMISARAMQIFTSAEDAIAACAEWFASRG